MRAHSPAFIAVRDLLLGLNENDRRVFARLFGAMNAPEPDLSKAAIDLLRAIAQLEDAEIVRLGRWCQRYINRWGQAPKAASFAVDPRAAVREHAAPDRRFNV